MPSLRATRSDSRRRSAKATISTLGVVSAAMPSRANGKSQGVKMQLCAYWISMLDDPGQVAHVAGHDHVALVLHGPGLAAVAHPQVALALVGAEGHEQDHRALVDEVAGQLGKLAVVADQYADGAAVGLDGLQGAAALDVPPVDLVGGGMNLGLLVDPAVAQEDVADVLDLAVGIAGRVRAPDDVDVVAEGHLAEGSFSRGVYLVSDSIDS